MYIRMLWCDAAPIASKVGRGCVPIDVQRYYLLDVVACAYNGKDYNNISL